MGTVFENLSDNFYIAFFETDQDKRREAIEAWIKSAVPIIQSQVENDLRFYLDYLLEKTWTFEGWKFRARKYQDIYEHKRFFDLYKLVMDIHLRPLKPDKEKNRIADQLSTEVRAETLFKASKALAEINAMETKLNSEREKVSVANSVKTDSSSEISGGPGKGVQNVRPSANDQRSNVMNPNNPTNQAARDNRGNQMNPNNPAYWASRGHGGRHK